MPSALHIEAAKLVDLIPDGDKLAEMARRWPDLTWRDLTEHNLTGIPVRRVVEARWSRDGIPSGLQLQVPINATIEQLEEGKNLVARQALFNDEYRLLVG